MARAIDMAGERWAAARARSGEAVARWRASAPAAALARAFGDGTGDLAERARALLADGGWIKPLLAPLIEALAADPLFESPLKANRDRARIGVLLFDSPHVRVNATILSARMLASAPFPASVVMPGRLVVTRYVRANGIRIRRWRAAPPAREFTAAGADPAVELDPITPADGHVIMQDGGTDGHVPAGATGDVVTLSATVRSEGALIREYATDDGRLLRLSTLDDFASRGAMLLTLLRQCGRRDACHVFEAATRDRAFHMRWTAMREWLALDAGTALPRLEEMAESDDHPEVRAAAAAMLARARSKLEATACLA